MQKYYRKQITFNYHAQGNFQPFSLEILPIVFCLAAIE